MNSYVLDVMDSSAKGLRQLGHKSAADELFKVRKRVAALIEADLRYDATRLACLSNRKGDQHQQAIAQADAEQHRHAALLAVCSPSAGEGA